MHGEAMTVNRDAFNIFLEICLIDITVFASSVKGDGPASNPIFVITDQDSK